MNKCYIKIIYISGSPLVLTDCINFTYQKELYTPFSLATGTFLLKGYPVTPEASNIKGVELYINDALVHFGMPDDVSFKHSGGIGFFTFLSRSHTMLLAQNEPEPGINSKVNLSSVISKNITSPYITCEQNTPAVNYIYVKEKSTIWDAIHAYALKEYGSVPYIRSYNKVMVTSSGNPKINYSDVKKISYQSCKNTSLILSDVYMADLDGSYKNHAANSAASAVNIQRKKYYPLDRQWLSDPSTGLYGRLDMSQKKFNQQGFTYIGFLGEELMDKITGLGLSMNNQRINSITVRGNKKGIFTEILCYNDEYGQYVV